VVAGLEVVRFCNINDFLFNKIFLEAFVLALRMATLRAIFT
jgi:hypothetical protein